MHKLTLAAVALMSSAGIAAAQDDTTPPAPLEPVPMQSDASGTVIVDEVQAIPQGEVIQQGEVINNGTVINDGTVISDGTVYNGTMQQGQPVYTQQSRSTVYRQPVRQVRRTSNGFFGRMMELERRKNAWLRRTFLNR